MYFNLVDRVLERTDTGITTLKTVTSAEEYLRDHFPEFPILPGVMMLESMCQAAALWANGLRGDEGFGDAPGPDTPWLLAQTRRLVYSAMVRPGEGLEVRVTCRGEAAGQLRFDGVGHVIRPGFPDEAAREAVKGRFTLRRVEEHEVHGPRVAAEAASG